MQKTLTLLGLVVLAAALPNTNLTRRSVECRINFFKRYDCQNDCVEIGMCLSGQIDDGMNGSPDDWIGWDSGCWELPDGAHSVALAVNNGHKFSGINKSCKQWKEDSFDAQRWNLKVGDDVMEKGKCHHFYNGHIKAVFYHR